MGDVPPPIPSSIPDRGSVWAGLGMGCLGNLALLAVIGVIGMADGNAGLYLFAALGLLQLTYVIPMSMRVRKRGAGNTLAGIIIMASLTLLFTATCGALLINFNSGSMH